MLVRGDLGFVAVIVVVLTVIWIVIRRKWRIAAARREEIKRLLVFAAEESARAEFEATVLYESVVKEEFVSEKVPVVKNQCALCFSPAAKLCSQCKAVRYCSGKCQIIHWRQGHKQECRPYTIFDKGNEGKFSSQKEFNQEHASYGDSYELDKRQYAKKVETFPKNDTGIGNSDLLHRKDDIEGEGLTDDVESNSSATSHLSEGSSGPTNTSSESSVDASVFISNDSDGLTRIQTDTGISVKAETSCMDMDQNTPFTEKSSNLKKSVMKSGHYRPVCSDGDSHSFSCSSSGWSVDGSSDSLSEPTTPSSGFWEGTINSRRSTNGANDDGTQSSSSDSGGDMSGPVSSLGISASLAKNLAPAMPQQSFNSNTVISDGLSASRTKRHVSEADSSVKLCKDSLTSMKSTSLNSEISASMHGDTGYNSRVLKCRETKSSLSSNHCDRPYAYDQGHLPMKDIKKISNLPPLYYERSKVGSDTISSSRASKSQEVARLTSNSGRDAGTNFSKVGDSAHGVTAGSSKLPTDSTTTRTGLKSTMLKVVDQLKPSKISKHHSMGLGSETLEKYTVKGLFSYELFVKLYNWNKVDMQPCGLMNCGNSCYANAVLQCLAFTPPITAYLLQQLHSKTCQNKDWCFTCEFENLIVKAKEGNTPLSPIRILSHIENIGSHLDYGKEEDAHEFLRCAIDTLQSSCLKEAASQSPVSLNEETTLMGLTFGGYLRSKIKCMKCGGKSERNERIMDLTVEIDGNICTLEEALRKFTSTEILDGENKYNCSRCKSYEKARKKLTIIEAPNILTIALKRFQSGKFGKLSKSIQFPEILNMVPFMSSTSDTSPIYRLYGVVVHLDIMNASFSGHYICYVKNIQNKWFEVDDSSVNAVELESVLTKGAYMLLYARCSPRAPKLIRNLMVPRDPRKPKNPSLKSRSHSIGPCDLNRTDHLSYQTSEGFYQNHPSFQRVSSILEDDSSSDNSSSMFSEAGSCSTESSTRDSMSADDYFDQIFGDSGHNWNSSRWNTSDSDTSSSSSSPSPLYTRNTPYTSSDHYATRFNEENHCSADPAESAEDGRVWAKQPVAVGKLT
ncbi:Ubiquitin-specific protease 16 [Heracleum sosnowskyi]|uniref:ubiquitinyl hydrolase 1 n=1 Tax=Heracleum sosnowskyi TaxID=360622 RepID=A0AAD8JJQ7_9APIA|nr:Ubiquitin-specific protease 16 [Heracleum sosnowskyi]